MSANDLYIAVDLGAGSGRVILVGFGTDEFLFEEIHRFTYPPRETAGHLRWGFAHIFTEIKSGSKRAIDRAKELGRKVISVGVDSWAVDYGLVDARGELIADPVCYRDARTKDAMAQVFERVPRSEIFEKTGIQFLNFNTVFQLVSENVDLRSVEKILMLPDLINYFFTGKAVTEYTNATTTQLVNARTKDWDGELFEKLKLPKLLPKIVPAGTDLGPLIDADIGSANIKVIAPGTHDTASAIAGAPLEDGWAYISSGTWSLIGVERSEVLINEDVARHNFTNEGGVFDTIRFLKNVMGLWIFETCRREWNANAGDGNSVRYDELIEKVSAIDQFPGFIFPDDERFLNPPNMHEAIAEQLRETGQTPSNDPVTVAKIIFDSLAFRYASVLRTIEKLTGEKLRGVQIVGGGGKNEYLDQMTANACGLPVQAGVVEATALGNASVQAIATGRFASLKESREYVRKHVPLKEFMPRDSDELNTAAKRYVEIESRFLFC